MTISLRYGTNPHQVPATLVEPDGQSPLRVLHGQPGYINILDAFLGWQLVCELKAATGPAGGGLLQAHQPGGGGHRRRTERRLPPQPVPAG